MKVRCDHSISIGPIALVMAVLLSIPLTGCAPKNSAPSSALANKEVVDGTEIFLGSDRYYVQAQEPADSAEKDAPESRPESREESRPESRQETKSTTAVKKTTKPKVKPKPVDVEYVLKKAKDISVGLATDAAQNPSQIQGQNDDVAFVPASITKVLTTASALRTLGAGFKFKTQMSFDLSASGQASNLVVYSDGDPTVGTDLQERDGNATQMSDLANALKSHGVVELSGPITMLSSDSRMDNATYAPGIPDQDVRECYGAMSTSFNYRWNCAVARINGKNGFVWENAGADDFIKTSVETSSGDRNSIGLSPVLSPERVLSGFSLRGTYVAKAPKNLKLELPIGNAAGWYSQEFFKALRAVKVTVTRPAAHYALSAQERAAAIKMLERSGATKISVESAPLSALVAATNKPSDNFFADSIFKALGARAAGLDQSLGLASRGSLRGTLDGWLRADGHASWSGDFNFYDGAGLSADNRATPRAFLAVLRQLVKEPTFPVLWNSLPTAGVDGTLADRMKNTTAAGKVHGKTGTLSGAYQLVGFIPKVRGNTTEYIPFVILTSTTVRNRDLVRRFQDAVVVKMYDSVANEK